MQILPLIQSFKLMDHLTRDPQALTVLKDIEEVPNPTQEDWQQIDLLLHSWITDTLSKEVRSHVVGLGTSQEVWNYLEEIYLQAIKERKLQLKHQL